MSNTLNRLPPNTKCNHAEARTHWGKKLPEWIFLLAEACNRTSQKAVGKTMHYSGGTISRVLRKTYAGDMAEVKKRVMAFLGDARFACPVMKCTIAADQCFNYRRGIEMLAFAGHFRIACPKCPNNADRPNVAKSGARAK
jgi:hypothetical protein